MKTTLLSFGAGKPNLLFSSLNRDRLGQSFSFALSLDSWILSFSWVLCARTGKTWSIKRRINALKIVLIGCIIIGCKIKFYYLINNMLQFYSMTSPVPSGGEEQIVDDNFSANLKSPLWGDLEGSGIPQLLVFSDLARPPDKSGQALRRRGRALMKM
jgi:hypothetical protein